jgi:hypothetical protein
MEEPSRQSTPAADWDCAVIVLVPEIEIVTTLPWIERGLSLVMETPERRRLREEADVIEMELVVVEPVTVRGSGI